MEFSDIPAGVVLTGLEINPESSLSETESKVKVESILRQVPQKVTTKTDLEYYNTSPHCTT